MVSGLLWSLAYVVIIQVGGRDGVPGMPLVATLLNLSWELVFSFVFPSPAPQVHVNRVWFILDVMIAIQWLRFGRTESVLPRRAFLPALVFTFVVCLALMCCCVLVLGDSQGRTIAYSQNLLMSLLFLDLLRARGGCRGQSVVIAVLKLLGTLAAGVGTLLRGMGDPFIFALCVLILLADLVYLGALLRTPARADEAVAA